MENFNKLTEGTWKRVSFLATFATFSTPQKMKFSIKDFTTGNYGFGEETLNRKLYFLCSTRPFY